jgi:hypothetical protein
MKTVALAIVTSFALTLLAVPASDHCSLDAGIREVR